MLELFASLSVKMNQERQEEQNSDMNLHLFMANEALGVQNFLVRQNLAKTVMKSLWKPLSQWTSHLTPSGHVLTCLCTWINISVTCPSVYSRLLERTLVPPLKVSFSAVHSLSVSDFYYHMSIPKEGVRHLAPLKLRNLSQQSY